MNLSKMQVNAIVQVIQEKERAAYDKALESAVASIDKRKIQKTANEIGFDLEAIYKKHPEIDKAEIITYRFDKKNRYSCSCEKNVTSYVYKELLSLREKELEDALDKKRRSTSDLEREVIIKAIDCENIAQLKKVFNIE